MTLPLSLSILILAAVIAGLLWFITRLQSRIDRLQTLFMEVNTNYSDFTMKIAADQAKSAADASRSSSRYAEKMLDSLSTSTVAVVESIRDSMHTLYGPQTTSAEATTDQAYGGTKPLQTFYSTEGSEDYTDPTDMFLNESLVGGMSDGAAQAPGNLIMDDDDNPFGIPGLKIDAMGGG